MDNITAMLWSGCKLLLCASLFVFLAGASFNVIYEVIRYTMKHIKENKTNGD